MQLRRMIEQGDGDDFYKRQQSLHLDAMLALCETAGCRRQMLLAYFGEDAAPCGNCDNCLTPPETWDGTVAAQKLLSTIVRLDRERGRAFGTVAIIDILLGKRTPRVEQGRHDQLSTFGIGTELDDAGWRSVARQLLAQRFMDASGDYGVLRIAPKGADVLNGEARVTLRKDLEQRTARSTRRARGAAAVDELGPDQRDRFEQLRAWRREIATAQGVPAYVVFNDATLRELAVERPSTLGELAGISGIGRSKLEHYGDEVLEVLAGMG